ncbi:MAG: hypothetical protein HOC93_02070 [Phycisphaerae bacterium]|nr:hypothetical protein [Phycisphaerae bacterium]
MIQIAIAITIAFSAVAFSQDRPAPQEAPVIELPEPVIEEVIEIEPIVEEVIEINEPEVDVTSDEVTAQPDPEVTMVDGGNEKDVPVRWPLLREVPNDLVILGFDDVSIEETLGFIAQTTGKVVIPVSIQGLRAKKITLQNVEPIRRSVALDLLFHAFRLNQVGVIERADIIVIGPLDSMLSDIGDIPVLGVEEDVTNRQDRGTLVIKVFGVEKTEAGVIGDRINEMFPDYGSLTVDPISNQIVLLGDIGLCQQIQQLIVQLDRIWRSGRLKTFRLKHADASEISTNIMDIFEQSGTSSTRGNARNNQANRGRTSTPSTTTTDEVELRLTVNMQQNSVTVQAEPDVMEEIAKLITDEWDLPRPVETSKLYTLKYSDPIKIRNLLEEILGGGSSSGGNARSGQANRADVTEAISGVYRFEAYPDKNALLVLSKTEESFTFLDSIIESLDEPSNVGLPQIIELKHANAVSLAEEINALLAPSGVAAMIERPDQGLSGAGFGDSAAGDASTEQGGQMSFPWQSGGASSDDQSPESSLIAKIRLVPIIRQNALAVLAPPAYMQAIVDTINQFDQPTRQVMISATIASVTLTDDLELGLRWGSGTLPTGDNSINVNGDFGGTIDDILSGVFSGGGVFTIADNSLGAVLAALNQLTNVRVLQQPRTFTSDNQEAIFFNGQEIPVQTTQSQSSGVVTGGYEYRDVGVLLNVRPRITTHGNVDLTINVEISDEAGKSTNDNPKFSRRQVRSQILINDGQTVLLGGLLKEYESKTKRKIPLLGDIPLIGGLFTSVEDNTVREELIVFITPVIVETTSTNNIHNTYLERLHEISLPIDEQLENIDKGNDFLNQRLRNPAADYTPDAEPVQSAFDAAQPLQ